jgi:hypothetical protein
MPPTYHSPKPAVALEAGHFFLSDKPADPSVAPTPDSIPPANNGAIHTLSSIMKVVLSSATKAETGSAFFNCKYSVPICTCLTEMGPTQPCTPVQVDDNCAAGIINCTIKQRRSKVIDMRFHWLQDRVYQKQFHIHWQKGPDKLTDYFTKHQAPLHHRRMRSKYLLELHRQDMFLARVH